MSFPRYPKYKDSGVEWLGEVPEHWKVAGLTKHLASVVDYRGRTPTKVDDGIFLVTARNIRNGYIDYAASEEFIPESEYEDVMRRGKPEIGDVLFTTEAPLGQVANVDRTDIALAQRVVKFRSHPEVLDNYFLKHWLMGKFSQADMERLSTGSTALGIKGSKIGQLHLCLPTIAEQLAIVAFIEYETAKIDLLTAEQQRLIELLKEKRQAVVSHAVTRGLNPNVSMKPSGIEWLGDVPAHWEVKRLKHISPTMTVGVVVNPSTYVADEGLPFIYGGDIREGVIDWENARRITVESSELNAKTRLKAGDLLTVRVGAPGITAVVPAECDGGNCASVMLIRQGPFNSHWLCYVMNTRIVRFQVEVVQYGAAQEQFNIGHAIDFWIPTPPRAEQDEIAASLDVETAKLDTLITEAQRAIELLLERRTALISAAVTGQIDVRGLS